MPSASGGKASPSAIPIPVTPATNAVAMAQPRHSRGPGAAARAGLASAGEGTMCNVYSGARRSSSRLSECPSMRRHHDRAARPITIWLALRARATSIAIPAMSAPPRVSTSAPSPCASASDGRLCGASAGCSTCNTVQGACSASARRLACRTTASPDASGPISASTRSPAGQGPDTPAARIQVRTSSSTCSAAWRSAISRSAARLPSLKYPSSARFAVSAR